MEQTGQPPQVASPSKPGKLKEKSFRQLFSTQELIYYGAAVVVYIVLGLILRDKVLNVGVGPLFFILWIWIVPPVVERTRRWLADR